jgi:DNA polymerase-3 subunit alpha
VRIADAVAAAAADAMPALAVTDLANAFGLVKFYKAARAQGIKPIFGCDVWLTHDAERDQPFRALLLAQSRLGYLKLVEWLTRAYRSNQYRGRAEMRHEWFDEGTDGLIALSGARSGEVGAALLQGNAAGARKAAERWSASFAGRYYLEVQRAGHADDNALVAATARLAAEVGLPVVATHPVQFLRRQDFRAHEARVCIANGNVLADPRRPREFTADQYFTTQAEMAERFADLPGALANSVAIAQRCNLTIPMGRNYLPDFPTPPGVTLDEHLKREAASGLEMRLETLYRDAAAREAKRGEYLARLEFETKTIVQMGFAGYFLIVADFINWAKRNGVPVGPGRGSGAGSLVAYALGITDLDPLRYGLVFERLLNPERISMPDLDIDFCQNGRDRVIDYVKKKYGAESVAQIATFGTMAAKAAVRDVGRVLDLPYLFCDGIAKLIPFQPGKQVTLAEARAAEPLLAEREQKEEEVAELLALAGVARRTDAQRRNARRRRADRSREAHRLLSALHAGRVRRARVAVRQGRRRSGRARQVRLPGPHHAHDPRLDAALREASRSGERDLARDAAARRPRHLRHLQGGQHGSRVPVRIARDARADEAGAADALRGHHRAGRAVPAGPDGAHPRLHGAQDGPRALRLSRREARADPRSDVRRDGVPGTGDADRAGDRRLYARQGGLPAPRDGKKDKEEMAKHRDIFVAGAERNGVSRTKATALFDLMEKFAGYGFNKSHSAAYALIAYQTAYFKAHHAAAFMAANLSLVMDDTDKVRALRDDAIANGLAIVPPDVNASGYRFEPIDAQRIRYGLGAIKGTARRRSSRSSLRARPAARSATSATSAGASTSASSIAAPSKRWFAAAHSIRSTRAARRFSLRSASRCPRRTRRRRRRRRCRCSAKRRSGRRSRSSQRASGPSPSGSRTKRRRSASTCPDIRTRPTRPSSRRSSVCRSRTSRPTRDAVLVAGIVTAMRTQTSRRGKMAIVTLDDGAGSAEVVVFNETFDSARALLARTSSSFSRRASMQRGGEDGQAQGLRVVAEAVHDLAAIRRRHAKSLRLACNGGADAARLAELIAPFRNGTCPIVVEYSNHGVGGELELPEAWSVNLDDPLLARLRDWLAPENVRVVY